MTPFILKNNPIKKAYLQILKCLYNRFYTNKFFKSNNIYKKHTYKPQTSL